MESTVLQKSAIGFNEPVEALLQKKGYKVWSISSDATVYSAIEMMSEKGIGALVVTVGGEPAGMISERDYARKVILKGRNSHTTLVREIMSSPVLYVTHDQTIEKCMEIMITRRVCHLPVRQNKTLVGIISIGDVLSWIVAAQLQTINHMQSYITGSYPS